MRRIIVGISGASGAPYGVRLLDLLACRGDIETHLIVSRAGEKTVFEETGLKLAELKQKATFAHSVDAIGAAVASGSFLTHGMAIAPCSVHTMSAIATGNTSNLLTRAADVTLKAVAIRVAAPRRPPYCKATSNIMSSLLVFPFVARSLHRNRRRCPANDAACITCSDMRSDIMRPS